MSTSRRIQCYMKLKEQGLQSALSKTFCLTGPAGYLLDSLITIIVVNLQIRQLYFCAHLCMARCTKLSKEVQFALRP